MTKRRRRTRRNDDDDDDDDGVGDVQAALITSGYILNLLPVAAILLYSVPESINKLCTARLVSPTALVLPHAEDCPVEDQASYIRLPDAARSRKTCDPKVERP